METKKIQDQLELEIINSSDTYEEIAYEIAQMIKKALKGSVPDYSTRKDMAQIIIRHLQA